ncbi:DNA/RNA helicase domain-containing protein, partial [Gemmatimonadota bacterium]
AQICGASVHEMALESQFRCNGSDGYLAWVDSALQIRTTAHETLEGIDYDFRVLDDPNRLFELIVQKNRSSNKARVVAGYCWAWKGKKDPRIEDVTLPEYGFSKRWNLDKDDRLWIVTPGSVNEIGCIHTCQGLELEYVGVIIGPDLVVRNGRVQTDAGKRSSQDHSVRGYKKMLRTDPAEARAVADRIIKNTYRTLMTRGQKGCFLFCVDPETNEYFRRLAAAAPQEVPEDADPYPGLTLRILEFAEARPFHNCVPLFDLQIAAGHEFIHQQPREEQVWVQLPDSFRPQAEHFVTRVVGESMNRRIPNGSWCLFKANPGGTRQDKVVVVQHRDIQDPDTGSDYTIKLYSSQTAESPDGWEHLGITLLPDSRDPGYKPIVLEPDAASELRVVGELVAILC